MDEILILTNSIGGIYNFRRELIDRLTKEGYEVTVVAPREEKIYNYLDEMNCKFIEAPVNSRGTNLIADLKLFFKYFKIIKKVNPKTVLTYTIKPNIYGGLVCTFLRVPYVVNITGLGTAVENKGILQKLTLFLYRLALKKVSIVYFQNKENMLFIENKKIAIGKHKLIPGSGVNLEHFSLMDYPKTQIIEFLFIARVIREKGIEQFLEAAEFIKNKYPNTVFHILGSCDESYVEKIKEMQNKGIVIYHGRQKNIREFHRISHCTIHPTFYPEGMSNVLLESAACGRPAITTDRSGCREIIDDGINGYLVESQNGKDLIRKIEKFLEQDYEDKKKMGLEGRKKVESEFDRNIVVEEYLNEINRMG